MKNLDYNNLLVIKEALGFPRAVGLSYYRPSIIRTHLTDNPYLSDFADSISYSSNYPYPHGHQNSLIHVLKIQI